MDFNKAGAPSPPREPKHLDPNRSTPATIPGPGLDSQIKGVEGDERRAEPQCRKEETMAGGSGVDLCGSYDWLEEYEAIFGSQESSTT